MFCAVSLTTTFSFAQTNVIPATGDVGIGTLTPSAKLDVNGRMNVDSMVVFKDSLRVQKKLIVDQDVKIQGKSVFVGNGKFKNNLRVLGVGRMKDKLIVDGLTRMNGDAKIFGDLKIKSLENLNLTENRFLTLQPNGKVSALNKMSLINAIYQPITPCFIDQNGNVLSVWKQNPNPNHGILFTGVDCPARVGIGTDNPLAKLDVRGNSRFSGVLSLITNSVQNISPFKIRDINTNQDVFVIKSDGKVGVGTTLPEDKLQVGGNSTKLVMGSAYSQDLGYGTSYVGFNASRNITGQWKTASDGAHDGGSIIYGDVFGSIFFSTIPFSGGAGQTGIPDVDIKNNVRMYIHKDGNINIINKSKLVFDGTQPNWNTWEAAICAPMGAAWVTTHASNSGYYTGIGMTNTGFYYGRSINPVSSTNTNIQYLFQVDLDGRIRARAIRIDTFGWADYVFDNDYELMSLSKVEAYIKENKHLPNIPSEESLKEKGVDVGEMQTLQMQKIEELTLYIIALEKRIKELEINE